MFSRDNRRFLLREIKRVPGRASFADVLANRRIHCFLPDAFLELAAESYERASDEFAKAVAVAMLEELEDIGASRRDVFRARHIALREYLVSTWLLDRDADVTHVANLLGEGEGVARVVVATARSRYERVLRRSGKRTAPGLEWLYRAVFGEA